MKVWNIILKQEFIEKYKLPFKGFVVDEKEKIIGIEKIIFYLKEQLGLKDDEITDIECDGQLVEMDEMDEEYSNLY